MFHKKNHPPTLNQQTGQWHFYDDEGKPIQLKKKPAPHIEDKPFPIEPDDKETNCCFRRRK